jgi:hypothetical protein
MARFTVLGFTEAELGFVLAALFVAVSGYQIVEARSADAGAESAEDRLALVQDSLRGLQQELEVTRDSLAHAREQAERLRAEAERVQLDAERRTRLTSRLTPYCSERGETAQPVAHIVVVNPTTYRLDGRQLTIGGVTNRLSRWLDISREKGCRFSVEVLPVLGLSAEDFMKAREPLSRLFYFR